jgi:hypothetical protein
LSLTPEAQAASSRTSPSDKNNFFMKTPFKLSWDFQLL